MKTILRLNGASSLALAAVLLFVSFAGTANYQLSGLVKDKSANPIPNATIKVLDPADLRVVASTTSGLDGRYTLSIPGGTYHIHVLPPPESDFGQAATNGRVIDRDTVIDFVLVPAWNAHLSGQLRSEHGLPGSEITFSVTSAGAPTGQPVTTAVNGSYAIDLAPGSYSISIDTYLAVTGFPNLLRFGSDPFPVTASQVFDLVLPLKQVTVTVQDPSGQPVEGVQLETNYPDSLFTIGSVPFTGYGGYPQWAGTLPVTGANGQVVLWLYPNAADPYVFIAHPPQGSLFRVFTLTNIDIAEDQEIIIVLQFIHEPPVTVLSLSPAPHPLGPYNDPTTVNLSATAAEGYTITETRYRVDGGAEQLYSQPFQVTGCGEHTIIYWSVDNVGVYEFNQADTFSMICQLFLPIISKLSLP